MVEHEVETGGEGAIGTGVGYGGVGCKSTFSSVKVGEGERDGDRGVYGW